jgi:hypothetical protein
MIPTQIKIFLAGACLCACAHGQAPAGLELGQFPGDSDIGVVSRPGTGTYDAATGSYTIGSSGANMWFGSDAMHFVWVSEGSDTSIAADINFVGTSAQPHRKACLVIRQNLTPGSPYVDVAVHGDGLTSLQFRAVQDGPTKEIQSDLASPKRVRLDKIGDTIYLSDSRAGEDPQPSGCSFGLHLTGPYYIGLAVSAHDNAAFETAVFSHVVIAQPSPAAAVPRPGVKIITLPTGDRRVAPIASP